MDPDENKQEQPTLSPETVRDIAREEIKNSEESIRDLAKDEIEQAKPGKDPEHELDVNLVSDARNQLTDLISSLTAECSQRPKEGAEVTLAVRALQQARMWLGVAKATAEGHDPWQKDVKKDDK